MPCAGRAARGDAVHIVMVTTGTQGEVQPFVAIGLGLQRAGYRVTLAANPDHGPFVTGHGLAFRSVGMNMREILESDAGRAWLESADSVRGYVRAFKRAFEPTLRPFLRDVHACRCRRAEWSASLQTTSTRSSAQAPLADKLRAHWSAASGGPRDSSARRSSRKIHGARAK
jgi:hypothetical protein